jgi:hypothetical protein
MRTPDLVSRRFAAVLFAVAAVYLGVYVFFVVDGLGRAAGDLVVGRLGVYAPLGGDRYGFVPWTRVPIALATLGGLAFCGLGFWRGDRRAFLVLAILGLGLALPQAQYVAAHMAAIHGWSPAGCAVVALAVVVVPIAALAGSGLAARFRRSARAIDWPLEVGRHRLLATAVVVAWTAFAAERFLNNAAVDVVDLVAGWLVLLAALAVVVAIVRLRTAALFGAVVVAAATGVLLARVGEGTGPLIELAPITAVAVLTAPFWRRIAAVVRGGG